MLRDVSRFSVSFYESNSCTLQWSENRFFEEPSPVRTANFIESVHIVRSSNNSKSGLIPHCGMLIHKLLLHLPKGKTTLKVSITNRNMLLAVAIFHYRFSFRLINSLTNIIWLLNNILYHERLNRGRKEKGWIEWWLDMSITDLSMYLYLD